MSRKGTRVCFALAIAFAGLAVARCPGSDTVTGPPRMTPTQVPRTPTPTPSPTGSIPNIDGSWRGTMAPKGCSGSFPVSATFSQDGSSVTGRLEQKGCIETFGTLYFTGKWENGKLSGTTTGLDFPGGLTGTLTGGTLSLDPYTSSGFHLGLILLTR
jgi:hypothetical protein